VSLGFGLLSAQLLPGESDWERSYRDTIDLAVAAERLGFSSVWTTEHHFVDDGYMPSLLVVSAAIAARTESIEIGTGVVLGPLHHPLRLAEDAATVALLSRNRLTLGLGLGWSEIEFDAFGADLRRRGKTMDELLTILAAAWSGRVFTHRGEVYELPELAVRPTPSRPVPIVIGGSAEAAIRRAARLADGVFANAPVDAFLQQVEHARDELAKLSKSEDAFRWLHYSIMWPADSVEQGWDEVREHLWAMMWKYSDMGRSADRAGPPQQAVPQPPPLTSDMEQRLRSRSVFVGPPEEIVAALREIRDRAGVPVEFVARSFFHTLETPRQIELMDRLATEVAPHL
jgi:probable F420-dependent oxidoreductase